VRVQLVDELRERLAVSLCAGSGVGGGGDDGVADDVSGVPTVGVLEDVGLRAAVDGRDEVDRVVVPSGSIR
jgi:hypothetical protein